VLETAVSCVIGRFSSTLCSHMHGETSRCNALPGCVAQSLGVDEAEAECHHMIWQPDGSFDGLLRTYPNP
jgi:hypothetical protein